METTDLTRNMFIGRKFKSYYVVWKPRGNDEICGKIFCLNRTMQYGNKTAIFVFLIMC